MYFQSRKQLLIRTSEIITGGMLMTSREVIIPAGGRSRTFDPLLPETFFSSYFEM